MKLKDKISEWREIMTVAEKYHDTAETMNPREMLRLLDFTDEAIAALRDAVRDQEPGCLCGFCQAVVPLLAKLDEIE
jgi:hypothetical protein